MPHTPSPFSPNKPQVVHPTSPRRAAWPVVLVAVTLVMGPIAVLGGREQAALWHAAVAQEERLQGNLAAASEALRRAIEWAPKNPVLWQRLSQVEAEREDYRTALEAIEEAVSLSARPARKDRYRLEKSDVLLHLRRYDEAIKVVEQLGPPRDLPTPLSVATEAPSDEPPPRGASQLGQYLNMLAYARALADKNVQRGIAEVTAAIQRDGRHPAYLDTRGYLYYRNEEFQKALSDLNAAVRDAERSRRRSQARLQKIKRTSFVDSRRVERQKQRDDKTVAVLRYHRALAWEAAGQTERAKEDYQRVRELGFEPNDHLF